MSWELTPQFWTIIWVLIATVTLSLIIFYIFKKKDPTKKEVTTGQVMAEYAIEGFDKFANDMHGGRLTKLNPYFLTIFVFIAMSAIVSLFGFSNAGQSIMMTFSLALISFIGIFIIGIASKGLWGFVREKYSNPLELFGQFGPLLSLAIRLFGSSFAFAVILDLIPLILSGLGMEGIAASWPIFGSLYQWVLLGLDFGLSMLQAYVFTVLTMMYWKGEASEYKMNKEGRAKHKADHRATKAAKKEAKIQRKETEFTEQAQAGA